MDHLQKTDKKVFTIIQKEEERQRNGIELIASENYTSKAVLEVIGSILTDKYSEGMPTKRYYKGNEFIDELELLAIDRAKSLFGADHVNVQPYSGSPANLAVYFAVAQPGDTIMGMSLDSGGHLTHGFKVSFSGKWFHNINYGLTEEGFIDYDQMRNLAKEYKPKLIWAGASAYPRIIDWEYFRKVADEIGAVFACDISHIAGLVVGGDHPSPIPFADIVTTTTHKTLRGPRGAMIMCKEEFAEAIDKAVFPGLQGGPHNHTTAGIAVTLHEASQDSFKEYAHQIVKNAKALADALIENGFTLISGGTDNHLMLLDMTKYNEKLTGKIASTTLDKVGITVNKNAIPNDPRKPWDPSGIRIGTPAITSRGLKEKDMKTVADFIKEAIDNRDNPDSLEELHVKVKSFISKFPLPGVDS